jgi:2'-5' RNA ligase
MIKDGELPAWAIRLRDERKNRLWSQKTMAIRLIRAADVGTRRSLPSVESVQRYVRGYEAGDHRPGDLYAELYCRAFGLSPTALFGDLEAGVSDSPNTPTVEDALTLTAWITATNASPDALGHLLKATSQLAQDHMRTPAGQLLTDVVRLHDQVQTLLRSGKQRLRETRELFRVDAELLAHASMILGDLNQDRVAEAFGQAALLAAQEAAVDEALAWAALAKTARWQNKFAESADLSRRGFERCMRSPVRTMLASYEARAAGLMGDVRRACDALARAEQAAEELHDAGPETSVWAFPRPRQALLAISVLTRIGDADAALQAVAMADAAWASGTPRSPSTWAQIRVGAGIAHLMKGSLDGALEQVEPMLTLESAFRMATVTRYLEDLACRLRQRRFRESPAAINLLPQIREFNANALTEDSRGQPMSPLPSQMIDRWHRRSEPGPGQGVIYWHVLFGADPGIRLQAQHVQERLSRFPGLHMTPLRWLHMTTLVVGPTEGLSPDALNKLVDQASRRTSLIEPIPVSLRKIIYHPEAITVAVDPKAALQPLFETLKEVTIEATGEAGLHEPKTWTPHVTFCYSTGYQPAQPLIDALGRELPPCDAIVNAVTLIVQVGAERRWNWHPIAQVPLGRAEPAGSRGQGPACPV